MLTTRAYTKVSEWYETPLYTVAYPETRMKALCNQVFKTFYVCLAPSKCKPSSVLDPFPSHLQTAHSYLSLKCHPRNDAPATPPPVWGCRDLITITLVRRPRRHSAPPSGPKAQAVLGTYHDVLKAVGLDSDSW